MLKPMILSLVCLTAAPALAESLPQALDHWTGLTPSLRQAGPEVAIGLPESSPVPDVLATARRTVRAGEPGWALSDAHVPTPTRLRRGGTLVIASQQGSAWLGRQSASLHSIDSGITLKDTDGRALRIDHATLNAASHGQDVDLQATLDGIHGVAPGLPLLPSAARVDGSTTPEGAAALSALLAGAQSRFAAPVTVNNAVLDVGPAEITARGAVTLRGQNDRDGRLTVTATHFDALMQALPQDGEALKALPFLLVLRQFAEKDGDALRWVIDFHGKHVLVDGIDVAALAKL